MSQGTLKFLMLALPMIVLGCQGKPSTPSARATGGGGRNEAARAEAAREVASQEWGDSGVTEAQMLSKLLRSDDVTVRGWAGQRLLDDPTLAAEIVPELALALSDPDEQVRWWVSSALGHVGAPAAPAVPALTKRVEVDSAWRVRAECIQAVARAAPTGEAALPAILTGLADEHEQVQSRAAYAFGQVEHWGPGTVPALIGLLNDERTYVRARAAEALGRVGPPAKAAVPALEKLAEETDAHVRLSSRDALSKILAGS